VRGFARAVGREPLGRSPIHNGSTKRRTLIVGCVLLAAIAYVSVQGTRSAPAATVQALPVKLALAGRPPSLSWPPDGEAAVGVAGMRDLYTHGPQRPVPIASVAKVMTAFVVLRDHPLGPFSNGPEIVVTPADVSTYQRDLASGQSVVAVEAGERLSERQALEALLLPSGNNIATMLAQWDAGSMAAFVRRMNATARSLGLSGTRYADASGVQPGTVSTAADQARLAMAAMALPALRAVVAMPQVTLPLAGVQYNVNALLGTDGIVGVKTGYTPQSGGCFVFAARRVVHGRPVTLVGAVLGQQATPAQPSALEATFSAAASLVSSAEQDLNVAPVIRSGETVGVLRAPWSGAIALRAATSVWIGGLPGLRPSVRVVVPRRVEAPVPARRALGQVEIEGFGGMLRDPLVPSRSLQPAGFLWRLADL
jgi:D-alanyl-D-alanine carboxypeptidase (penicillin-binding protein 5/6)